MAGEALGWGAYEQTCDRFGLRAFAVGAGELDDRSLMTLRRQGTR